MEDEVINNAMLKLCEHGLTVESILETTEEKLGELINGIPQWKVSCPFFLKQYDGSSP